MYCRVCGKPINEQATVCPSCGCNPRKGKKYCQNCGVPTTENQEMCVSCGVKLQSSDFISGFSGGTRQKSIAALLAFFLGWIGIHDFYLGYKKTGIIKIILSLTGVGAFITEVWSIIDMISILTGSKKDADGKPLI